VSRPTLRRLARVANRSPVSYSSGVATLTQLFTSGGIEAALKTFGSVGTVLAIVDAISSACAEPEWHLYRKAASDKDAERTIVTSHAALMVLERPNDFFTWGETVEAQIQHYDLTGLGWLLIGYNPKAPTLPLELWNVRPDKIKPVTDPEKFIVGYVYSGPGGEKIPLGLNEVMRIRRPDPSNLLGGVGIVQSVMADIEASKMTSEYHRNFFKNSAEPGGVIEYEEELSPQEFREWQERWSEAHKGVARAHRVAILERGAKWVDRKYTNKEMQFVELRNANREVIREAFRFPLPMLGTTTDVNRANAEAAEVVFARWLIRPRLERIRAMLNTQFLPMFGPGAKGLEFDFESPVPDDRAADSAELTARVNAAVALMGLGADPADTLKKLDLPDIKFSAPAPAPAPQVPADDPQDRELAALLREYGPVLNRAPRRLWTPRSASEQPELPTLAEVQEAWAQALASLLRAWREVDQQWNAELLDQILSAASGGDFEALTRLTVPYGDAADMLAEAMRALGTTAADQVAEDAAAQGVAIAAIAPTLGAVTPNANTTAAFLALERAISAGREAQRVMGPISTADEVVEHVKEHLDSLTGAQTELNLGGALTRAQHIGRFDTMRAAPQAAYYANEVLDKNTCKNCREIDGKWLGNNLMVDVPKTYPMSGYVFCLGRQRCRGMVSAIWRPEQAGE